MRFAICRFAEARGRSARFAEELRAWWAQFGDDVLVYAAEAKWPEVSGFLAGHAASVREQERSVRKGDMHLVVQKGRLFQQEHPEVPVLLDKGRFLVVDLDPETADRLAKREEPCFAIEPLRENQVVFDVRPAPAERRAPVP